MQSSASLRLGGNIPDLVDASTVALERVRADRPLIHIISNLVTLGDVANATLAIGARPIMAQSAEEVHEIVLGARALVLNLGTPSPERIHAMLMAGETANSRGIPVVFDPVGIGASAFRQESAAQILHSVRVAVIRGNAGEMGALARITGVVSGVDTCDAQFDRAAVAQSIAAEHHTVATISGSVDYCSTASRTVVVENGVPQMQRFSGAGDVLDALVAAALAVEKDALMAAVSGLLWLGVAAEQAALVGRGIGSFRSALFDALDNLDAEAVLARGRANIV